MTKKKLKGGNKKRKVGRPRKWPPKQKRPVGRPRENYEFHEARELVRNEGLRSVGEYAKWWEFNKPAMIPKRPDRAYKKDWQGWGDFLGVNNPFPFIRKKFRPYKEARAFAQQLGFTSKQQWIEYAKSEKKPIDIPSRPDLVYRDRGEWFTWKDFLGSDLVSRKRNFDESDPILFIIQNTDVPSNVYQIGITIEGKTAILQAQKQFDFAIVGLYHCDINLDWQSIAKKYGSSWEGAEDEFLIPNVHEFIFDVSQYTSPLK